MLEGILEWIVEVLIGTLFEKMVRLPGWLLLVPLRLTGIRTSPRIEAGVGVLVWLAVGLTAYFYDWG